MLGIGLCWGIEGTCCFATCFEDFAGALEGEFDGFFTGAFLTHLLGDGIETGVHLLALVGFLHAFGVFEGVVDFAFEVFQVAHGVVEGFALGLLVVDGVLFHEKLGSFRVEG